METENGKRKRKTETENGNGKRKFVLLGRQTLNGDQRLLSQQTAHLWIK